MLQTNISVDKYYITNLISSFIEVGLHSLNQLIQLRFVFSVINIIYFVTAQLSNYTQK